MSTAIATSFRQRVRICTSCRGRYLEGHICPDIVRHPAVERVLDGLRRASELQPSAVWQKLAAAQPWDLSELEAHELEAYLVALEVGMAWERLPPEEQHIVNRVLEHAGSPPLDMSLTDAEPANMLPPVNERP